MERNTRIEEELFPFYALDALTEEERDEVERYVAGNPEAGVRLAELSSTALYLVEETAPISPPAAVKASLMARIEAENPAARPIESAAPAQPRPPARKPAIPRRPWWQSFAPALGAFAALALIVSGITLWQLSRQVGELREQVAVLQQDAGSLQTQVGALESENETLRRELLTREDLLAQFSHPGAVTLAIGDATGENPAAVGTLTFDPTAATSTLRVANLPPLDTSETYQAWVIVGETPHSAGTFSVDESGLGTHIIPGDLPTSFDAVGVSIEPAGGSETPTPGNIILLGNSF